MRRVLTVAAALALCSGAYADIESYLDCYYQADVAPGSDPLVPDFNDVTYYTIDLRVIVSNNDDWTSSAAEATIDSGVFFDHPSGDNTPPMAAFVHVYPAMEFDSFYCATESDPTNQPPYKDPVVGGDPIDEPQYKEALWYDTPANGGDGDFLHARYTIKAVPEELPVTFHVSGASTTYNGGGYLYPFELTCVIPEPGSLVLLGLGLALIRRR